MNEPWERVSAALVRCGYLPTEDFFEEGTGCVLLRYRNNEAQLTQEDRIVEELPGWCAHVLGYDSVGRLVARLQPPEEQSDAA